MAASLYPRACFPLTASLIISPPRGESAVHHFNCSRVWRGRGGGGAGGWPLHWRPGAVPSYLHPRPVATRPPTRVVTSINTTLCTPWYLHNSTAPSFSSVQWTWIWRKLCSFEAKLRCILLTGWARGSHIIVRYSKILNKDFYFFWLKNFLFWIYLVVFHRHWTKLKSREIFHPVSFILLS